jgi:small subunit ribosomal protein S5
MRAIFDALGVQDVVGKSLGSTCPHNMVKATLGALHHSLTPRFVAAKRGRTVSEVFVRSQKRSAKDMGTAREKKLDEGQLEEASLASMQTEGA